MTTRKFRVLELFAGMGGLHWALKVASVPFEVVAAMEINPTVIDIYKHNFPDANVISKNLEGLSAQEVNELDVDAIIMSPPCQPFCRMGNRLDVKDNRTGPLSHITNLLRDIKFKYIFVENVQGFEDSTARDNLLEVLQQLNFTWQEFMITPRSVNVPNSRLRYYLIGKHADLKWSFETNQGHLLSEIPNWSKPVGMPFQKLKELQEMESSLRRERWKAHREAFQAELNPDSDIRDQVSRVGDIMEWDLFPDSLAKLKIKDSILTKYIQAMDIVTPMSESTCCFTKGYGHFVKGTGSVLQMESVTSSTDSENKAESVNPSSLRYFSPKEISRLMSYPEEFQFPENLTLTQKYKSLGNSVNVYVVALMFSFLFSADS